MESFNIGLIGAGAIANAHLFAYSQNPLIKEIALADVNEEALARMKANYPKVRKTFTDYRRMLEDEAIQIIDICLPHYLHHRVTIDSLSAGKDVICEKPIAITLEEADDMIETARRLGKRLFISMNQRFMPYHKEAKKLIDEGKIGKPFLAVFNIMGNAFNEMNAPDHWKGSWDKAGGGALFDTGYHAIYMMLYFLGKPKAVIASTKRLLVKPDNKADDNSVAILEFEDALGTIAVSYTIFSEGWSEKRYIYGTEGSLHIQDEIEDNLVLFKNGQPQRIDVNHPKDIHPHPYSVKCALDHFIDCVVKDKEPEVKAEEARETLAVALAIYRSAREGKKVYL
ncbi:Gfo/Idh/MocA family oxidoreductase [bacterium]|nr:Gfo/Idh/MocA family oxidoreductase [bacterium]